MPGARHATIHNDVLGGGDSEAPAGQSVFVFISFFFQV